MPSVLPFTMENTAVNKKAMRDLEITFPWMLNLVCNAHALSLLNKDLSKHLPRFWALYTLCINLSNPGNGVEAVKSSLHECMISLSNFVRSICSHVDTSFGSTLFVLRDIMKI